jgi:hypothetical protein
MNEEIRNIAKRKLTPAPFSFVLLVIIIFTLSISVMGDTIKPRVFVYVNTMTKARTLQKQLQSVLSMAEVKVFSRASDFHKAVSDDSPEAVIARKNLVQAVQMQPVLQGMQNGKSSEPYSLLSVDTGVVASSLAGKNVGAVDELGRRETSNFVAESLGVKPKIKRTVKVEDLLALLQFSAAEAVLLPRRLIPALKSSSQLKLVETPLPNAKMALPAAGFASDEARNMLAPSIKSMSKKINDMLGVDSWQ